MCTLCKGKRNSLLKAISRHGQSLQFASDELKRDREIVLKAACRDVRALEFASDGLKGDPEFILQAVSQLGGQALEFAS